MDRQIENYDSMTRAKHEEQHNSQCTQMTASTTGFPMHRNLHVPKSRIPHLPSLNTCVK